MTTREKLDKLKAQWGLKTDDDLAKTLNIPKETVNSWIKRKVIPEKWELKIGQMNNNSIIGNSNIQVVGAKNSIGFRVNQEHDTELNAVVELLREYGSKKMIEDLKEKLLQIKKLHG